jgi:hypothetical protein
MKNSSRWVLACAGLLVIVVSTAWLLSWPSGKPSGGQRQAPSIGSRVAAFFQWSPDPSETQPVIPAVPKQSSPVAGSFPFHPAPMAMGQAGSRPHTATSMVGGHAVEYPNQFADASVHAGNQNYLLTPNQLGNFERVNIAPKQKVAVDVSYPEGQAGDPVSVEVEDGGHLNQNQMAEVTALDGQDSIHFQFQPTDQAGIYRIVLRSGADVKVVNFWVGQEPQIRE